MAPRRGQKFVATVMFGCLGRFASAQIPDQTPPAGGSPAADTPPPAPPAAPPEAFPPRPMGPLAPAAPMTAMGTTETPQPAAPVPSPLKEMMAHFSATFYGFAEFDSIWDSTQSFNELAGNGVIQHAPASTTTTPMPSTPWAADHGRTQFGARNSRIGFKLKGPDSDMIKTSAVVEADFLGNQPQGSPSPAGSPAVSEGSYFTSPTVRMRHYYFKMKTPFIEVLAGQTWQLFGWQSMFHPSTVEIQGVPGQIYSRSPQLRLSHTWKSDIVNVDLAGAASRPPQRDSQVPDGQLGIRLAFPGWEAMHTAGSAGSAADPAAVGFSTVGRYFNIPNFAASPTSTVSIKGYGFSADALIPIIPVTDVTHPDNALTFTGSFVYGQAIADLYSGLSGGASVGSPPNNAAGMAQTYPQDVDNGLIGFMSDGSLRAIRWESYILGLQYYLPTQNRIFLAANYSHMHSSDISALGPMSTKLFDTSYWADGNLFVDANPSVRLGLEYAYFHQHFLDGSTGANNRIQFSAFYIF